MLDNIASVIDDITVRGHKELFKSNNPNEFIYNKYIDFLATGKYPYMTGHDNVVDYIKSFLPALTPEQEDHLKTHVYYSSCKVQENRESAEHNDMLNKGWQIISKEVIQEAVNRRYYLLVCEGTDRHVELFKPAITSDGKAALMKTRARVYGCYALSYSERPRYYKYSDQKGNPILI